MNILFTIAVLAVLAMWALAVYLQLQRLRHEILMEWKQLKAPENTGDAKDGSRYNQLAANYNAAIEAFPGIIIAGLAGFRPAQLFVKTQ